MRYPILWAVPRRVSAVSEEIDRAVQAILQFLEGGSTMNVAIGSDHGGFRAKQALVEHLRGQGFSVEDLGTDSADSCDYPDIAKKWPKQWSKADPTWVY